MSDHPQSKPLFFFVHGAWAASWTFTRLIPHLWEQEYPTWSRDLPNASGVPHTTGEADQVLIRSELLRLSEAGFDIIPVCFSYGGVLGAACIAGLTKKERTRDGLKGGVVAMVISSGLVCPKKGMTSTEVVGCWPSPDAFGGMGLNAIDFSSGDGLTTFKDPSAFYSGLPASVFPRPARVFDHQFSTFSFDAHNAQLPAVPFNNQACLGLEDCGGFLVPTAYLISEDDPIIPTEVQERIVHAYKAHWHSVMRIPGGHLWAIAEPELAAKELIRFAHTAPSNEAK